jgi:hypothetical protein
MKDNSSTFGMKSSWPLLTIPVAKRKKEEIIFCFVSFLNYLYLHGNVWIYIWFHNLNCFFKDKNTHIMTIIPETKKYQSRIAFFSVANLGSP